MLLVVIAMLLLAACGGGAESGDVSGAVDTGNGTAETVADPATPVPATPGVGQGAEGGGEIPTPGDGGDIGSLGPVGGSEASTKVFKPNETGDETDIGDLGGEEFENTESDAPATTEPAEKTFDVKYVAAVIKVNQKIYDVKKKSKLPSNTKQFTVGEIYKDSVVLRLTAGTFADGSNGLLLEKGRPVTLVNQSDGLRYTIKLVSTKSQSSSEPGGVSDGTESPFDFM